MRTPTAFERERAEGEGAFFGRSIASEKKVRRPVKRERTRQSHPGYFFYKKSHLNGSFVIFTKNLQILIIYYLKILI